MAALSTFNDGDRLDRNGPDDYVLNTSSGKYVKFGTVAQLYKEPAKQGSATVLGEVSGAAAALSNSVVPVNVSGSAASVAPPPSPNPGDWFEVVDSRGNASVNNITVDFVTAGIPLNGASDNFVIDVDGGSAEFVYIDATVGWAYSL
ncbi:MAG: hypothetical protein D6800_11875 [Candidatus Zixiibacteriota bacterium]|nr:MAG: hypothetical protein D6800_11875 [candidate division Zixibacteria bacterium]